MRFCTDDAALRKTYYKYLDANVLVRTIEIAIHFSNSTEKQSFLKLLVQHMDTTKHSQTSLKGKANLVDCRLLTSVINKVITNFCLSIVHSR